VKAELGPSASPVFLQVAWDGLRQTQLLPIAAWGGGQNNAPLVGIELRRLLAAVDSTAPVRVIAHSLGALVVANAFWDASDTFKGMDEKEYRDPRFRAYLARAAGGDSVAYRLPPHTDVRVGLVAPATTARIFTRYHEPSGRTPQIGRLVVGLNEKDFVTNKGGPGRNIMGGTALGASRDDFCENVVRQYPTTLGRKAHLVDLYEPDRNSKTNREHGWVAYANRAGYPKFVSLIFTADTAAAGDQVRMCALAAR
jgi:hypothetical protein